MNVVSFTADSPTDAVEQIRARLGQEAVVLNVRQLPAAGLARLWRKPRLEVLACAPSGAPAAPDPLEQPREEVAALRHQLAPLSSSASGLGVAATHDESAPPATARTGWSQGPGRVGAMLEAAGVLPRYARALIEVMRADSRRGAPESLAEEIALARKALVEKWQSHAAAKPVAAARVHVLVGPPGVGKTTCLCKWLAQLTLLDARPARVWRLDSPGVNTADRVTIYGEILGVPVERFRPAPSEMASDELLFVDLPGVPAGDADTMAELGRRVAELPAPQVHLVLNAAYETTTLLNQVRAFSSLPVDDLVMTHLDEEKRWGKLWNLVLGTNFCPRYLSAGQNVPGLFQVATAEALVSAILPENGQRSNVPADRPGWQVSC